MNTTPVAIVTDSTCDIPAAIASERQIYVLPLHIQWGTDSLRDGVDISREAFYQRLVSDPVHPSTSQPTPQEFVEIFQRAKAETGAQAVLAVTISSALSGTYNAARQAVDLVDFPVHLIDSRTTSGALGLLVLALADLRDQGVSVDELVARAHEYTGRTRAILTIDTLDFLHRSGRVSAARRWLGQILQIKPILHVEDGELRALEAVRTRRNALNRMLERFNSWIQPDLPLSVAILYGTTPEDADWFEQELRARWQPRFIMKVIASSAVGVHTGPGAMGLTLFQ
ncbi:MAG: DegV family protein [Anaerolineae bacterium]